MGLAGPGALAPWGTAVQSIQMAFGPSLPWFSQGSGISGDPWFWADEDTWAAWLPLSGPHLHPTLELQYPPLPPRTDPV
jgi:hypothetical protein